MYVSHLSLKEQLLVSSLPPVDVTRMSQLLVLSLELFRTDRDSALTMTDGGCTVKKIFGLLEAE